MSSRHRGGVEVCLQAKLISILLYTHTQYISGISFMYESEKISSCNVHLVGTEQHLVGNNNSGSLISRFRVVEHR